MGVCPSGYCLGAPHYGIGQGLGNKGSRVKKKKVSEDWASAEAIGLGKELGRKADQMQYLSCERGNNALAISTYFSLLI